MDIKNITTPDPAIIIDRSNEHLIDNRSTFYDLIRILAANPDMLANAKMEEAEKVDAEKEAKLRKIYGDDYDIVFDRKKAKNNNLRRPGPIQLRTSVPRVAAINIGDAGLCEVFNNGYAIYDNGNRRVVIWVPDCGRTAYYFTELKDNERMYQPQTVEIENDVMEELPWYIAIVIAGENRIEFNMDHPKSKGTTSDFDTEDEDIRPANGWANGSRFENPEDIYLRKEAAEERKAAMTEKQRQVYIMYYEEGFTEAEIASRLNMSRRAVRDRLQGIMTKFCKNFEYFFE